MAARGAALVAATLAALALGAGTASAKPRFGVVPQDGGLPSARDLDRMPRAGIGGIRLMASWATVERVRGIYDWSALDTIVGETTRRGLTPLLFFYGSPEWAARLDGHDCRGSACTVYAPASAETQAGFAEFAAAAVRRYGPGGEFWTPTVSAAARAPGGPLRLAEAEARDCPLPILCPPPPEPPPPPPPPPPEPGEAPCRCDEPRPLHTWQVWNEQNSPKYFAPTVDVARFASLLGTTSAAVRAVDPGAELVLGGMWGPRSARKVLMPVKRYLRKLYAIEGIEGSFDSIALHPYASGVKRSVRQLSSARKLLRKVGDRAAGTWITELGWAAGGPRRNPYVKGLDGQARLLARALRKYKRKSKRFRVRGVFWYSWRDKAGGRTICEWCGHAGLRTRKGLAKPSWKAFARVAR